MSTKKTRSSAKRAASNENFSKAEQKVDIIAIMFSSKTDEYLIFKYNEIFLEQYK